ncbi:carbon-nitrogen family hydrolase [Opitutales bacterium ASA1]|uniref:nitrilase-related carbon-nitrogen hydrolase n=1 Tax=Congregicoccus parvus TaxID=3081749 RepID=UPI002B31C575|nr:carbon-nitrogen family hydrolase [Opitutales bacterium ASA1]
MRTIVLQYDIAWEDREANIATVSRLAETAKPEPGDLLVLPEMGLTGFSMSPARVADSEARETESALSALAVRHRTYVIGGYVSRAPDGRGRNQALLALPDGAIAAVYTKIHPFSHTGEHRRYEAGREIVTVSCGDFVVAPFICYDLRFPEIFRTAARRGATLLVVVASWPEARHAHWRALLQARAIENQCWVVGSNRCGRDPKFTYRGGSIVVDPFGTIVAEADAGETALAAALDAEAVHGLRRSFPVLEDLEPHRTLA